MIDTNFAVVFQPGNYYLDKTLTVSNPDQVLLGIGMATLIPTGSGPLI
jgi:hypothetical protein